MDKAQRPKQNPATGAPWEHWWLFFTPGGWRIDTTRNSHDPETKAELSHWCYVGALVAFFIMEPRGWTTWSAACWVPCP